VLARIDDRLAAAEVAQAEAALKQARSVVQRAQADLEQYKAKLPEAEARWTGTQQLQKSGATNSIELITYKSGYDVAKANVAVGEAAIVQAQDAVTQAEATLQQAGQKHSFCVVRSPVKGVVLERRVSVGQTIICNMNAPSLFLIAKDLHRMQVRAAVSEADIGKIHAGQPVRFTAEAMPGSTFSGTVSKVRLNASTTEHGATYAVEATTDNADGRLLPYLTASVQFQVDRQ
jgi:HlyD family secretion protein